MTHGRARQRRFEERGADDSVAAVVDWTVLNGRVGRLMGK